MMICMRGQLIDKKDRKTIKERFGESAMMISVGDISEKKKGGKG